MEHRTAKKLFLLLSIMVVGLASASIWFGHYVGTRRLDSTILERSDGLRSRYETAISEHSAFLMDAAVFIANDPTVRTLFSSAYQAHRSHDQEAVTRNRKRLADHLSASWRASSRLSHSGFFRFHFPPATNLLRLDAPDRYGDDLSGSRPSIAQVSRSGQPVVGIETRNNQQRLRVLIPLAIEDDTLTTDMAGTLELGINLEWILTALSQDSHSDFGIWRHTPPERAPTETTAAHPVIWASDPATSQSLSAAVGSLDHGTLWASGDKALGIARIPLTQATEQSHSEDEKTGTTLLAWFPVDEDVAAFRSGFLWHIVVTLLVASLIELIIFHTLTRERDLRAERRVSMTDPLTGVANRRHFEAVIDQEIRRAARSGLPLSLLITDIDHFKLYNDRYGHPEGDRCICEVASTLTDGLRRAGDFVARYGGEEFVAVLPATSSEEAALVANRLREAVKARSIPHAAHPSSEVVTVSFGTASIQIEAPFSAALLLAAADQALYDAKHAGRDCVRSRIPEASEPALWRPEPPAAELKPDQNGISV